MNKKFYKKKARNLLKNIKFFFTENILKVLTENKFLNKLSFSCFTNTKKINFRRIAEKIESIVKNISL